MKILVLVKQVPDTATQVKVGSDPRMIDGTGVTWIVSASTRSIASPALCPRRSFTSLKLSTSRYARVSGRS